MANNTTIKYLSKQVLAMAERLKNIQEEESDSGEADSAR